MFRTSVRSEERAMTFGSRGNSIRMPARDKRARYRADHGDPGHDLPLGARPRAAARGVHGSTRHRQHGGLGGDAVCRRCRRSSWRRATWRRSRTGMPCSPARSASTFTDGIAGGVRGAPGRRRRRSHGRDQPVELRQVHELHRRADERELERAAVGRQQSSLAAVCVRADEPIHAAGTARAVLSGGLDRRRWPGGGRRSAGGRRRRATSRGTEL